MTYVFWWRLANRIRRKMGKPVLPKRCCRNLSNRGPVIQDGPDLTYQRCQVCGCRHFTLTADPGHLGIVGR